MQKIIAIFLTAVILTALPGVYAEDTNESASGSVSIDAHEDIEYTAVNRISDSRTMTGTIESTGANENAVLVVNGNTAIKDAQISCICKTSTTDADALNYGIGAAVLVTGGTVDILDSTVTTQTNGATGIFAYGAGVATANDCRINTANDASGGIRVAAGGTLFASGLSVLTYGQSSAAIGSGQGGGSMLINGGSYITYGEGSPAVNAAGDTTINSASLVANNSEALSIEGASTVRLNDCVLSGNMAVGEDNTYIRAVSICRSESDAQNSGAGILEMCGGTLNCENGSVFFTRDIQSIITLKNVIILKNDDADLLRCTASDAADEGSANCVFTAVNQTLRGNITLDKPSDVKLYLTENSTYTGTVIAVASAEENTDIKNERENCDIYIDDSSCWIVSGSCKLGTLECSGIILDNEGKTVSIMGTDGTSYVEGNGSYTISVREYNTTVDTSGANGVDRY